MIELLKRPEGATVEQIAEATGWQHHTIRGAISGALKKKLGLTVEATRTREVGPKKTGAKGSSTVYRITGARVSADHMHGLLKQPGYRLYAPGSPEARALLAEQGLGPADLERALARLETPEGTAVRTIVGINEDGVFGSADRAGDRTCPTPARSPSSRSSGSRSTELLGRVPEGSTARFVKNGTLPGGCPSANVYRMAACRKRVQRRRSASRPAGTRGARRVWMHAPLAELAARNAVLISGPLGLQCWWPRARGRALSPRRISKVGSAHHPDEGDEHMLGRQQSRGAGPGSFPKRRSHHPTPRNCPS